MNVYDFDKTIYDGDSTVDFYFYCLRHYPSVYRKIPEVLWYGAGFALGIVEKKRFKSRFFKFYNLLPNGEVAVSRFWDKNFCKIKRFYLEHQKDDDVIISASPRFILDEVCKRLKIHSLICTETDRQTCGIVGENCYGFEKVLRFEKEGFAKENIDEFYSDSLSDSPLAELAKSAYIVEGNRLVDWNTYKQKK